MTAKADDAAVTGVTDRAPGDTRPGLGQQAGRMARSRYESGWLALLPAAVTAVIVDIGITVPSYWRDEAATVAAVQRPLGALVRMLGHVDAVHGFYYLLLWPITQLFGTGAAVTRMPSLIAMAVPAGLLTAIGRRLASPGIGVTAGLVFAVAPSVTVYGQMARSYALVTMVAATASYGLVRALEEDASRVRWLWYAVSIAALGAMNIFALLLIPAHAITMYLRYRRPDASARRRADAGRGGSRTRAGRRR